VGHATRRERLPSHAVYSKYTTTLTFEIFVLLCKVANVEPSKVVFGNTLPKKEYLERAVQVQKKSQESGFFPKVSTLLCLLCSVTKKNPFFKRVFLKKNLLSFLCVCVCGRQTCS
jgi:hypothetical protein